MARISELDAMLLEFDFNIAKAELDVVQHYGAMFSRVHDEVIVRNLLQHKVAFLLTHG